MGPGPCCGLAYGESHGHRRKERLGDPFPFPSSPNRPPLCCFFCFYVFMGVGQKANS
jgi:hypothetical protein